MQKFNLALIALFGFAVLLTTACGSGAAASGNAPATAATVGADGTQRISVTVGSGMSFDAATISSMSGGSLGGGGTDRIAFEGIFEETRLG